MQSRTLFLMAVALGASTFAAALWFQYVQGLPPCVLCIWQRYGLGLGIGGAVLAAAGLAPLVTGVIGALGFTGEAVVAAYHTGVERGWWKGPETCSGGSLQTVFDPEAFREALAGTPPPACNEIPWSLFGLSMANYNIAIALFMAGLCFVGLMRRLD